MSVLGLGKDRQECAARGSCFISCDVQMIDRRSGGHSLWSEVHKRALEETGSQWVPQNPSGH